ncbi:Uncharacterised protein [Pseudomonas aeruginosa]|nr:Uncharacterised protein [Pseudomonas aeruginosa]
MAGERRPASAAWVLDLQRAGDRQHGRFGSLPASLQPGGVRRAQPVRLAGVEHRRGAAGADLRPPGAGQPRRRRPLRLYPRRFRQLRRLPVRLDLLESRLDRQRGDRRDPGRLPAGIHPGAGGSAADGQRGHRRDLAVHPDQPARHRHLQRGAEPADHPQAAAVVAGRYPRLVPLQSRAPGDPGAQRAAEHGLCPGDRHPPRR